MRDEPLEALIRLVVEEVLKTMGPAAESASCSPACSTPDDSLGGDLLCIFFDAATGLEEVGRQLGYLQTKGLRLGCIRGSCVLPETFQPIRWSDDFQQPPPGRPPQILERYKAILIPNLSRRALAELATGACAMPQSGLVYSALGRRLPVVAVQDPLMPERVQCTYAAIHLSAVQQMAEEQIDKVRRLGVELIPSETVCDYFLKTNSPGGPVKDAYRGFLTLEDIEGFQGNRIHLVRGTRLTPLAEEWLHDRGIEIRFVDP